MQKKTKYIIDLENIKNLEPKANFKSWKVDTKVLRSWKYDEIYRKWSWKSCLPNPIAFLIVKIDASNIGYGGILKQHLPDSKQEQIVRYHSGIWLGPQVNYSTIKKEILSIVLRIQKFQDGRFNKSFLLQAAKGVLQKDVKNLVWKEIFARWQTILSVFCFNIELKEYQIPFQTFQPMNSYRER